MTVDSARTGWKHTHVTGTHYHPPGSDADAYLDVLRSWADAAEWTEFLQQERVRAAMSDLEQGGAAVLTETIAAGGQTV